MQQAKLKHTEIGAIPEDWDVKEIGEEIDLLTGFPFPSAQYTKSGIRLLRGSNIKRGNTDWADDITEYWGKVTFELQQYTLNEGDIVIAMDGSLVGRSFARLSKQDLPALLLQRVARIRSKKIDMGYLKEWICGDKFTKHCDSVKTVTAIPHISPDDIRAFVIPLPPTKEEQSAIASVLSDTDALIEQLDNLITKKKNIKQGAMQELLTGKRRLPGFKGEWEDRKLRDIANFVKGRGLSKSKMSDDGNSCILYGELFTTYSRVIKEVRSKTNYKEGLPSMIGDILMPGSTTTIGIDLAIASTIKQNNVLLGGDLIVIRQKKPQNYDSEFLANYLTYISKYKIAEITQGITIIHLHGSRLQEIQVTIPCEIKEQSAIAQVLSDMDLEIEKLEQKRDKYLKLKTGMMQQLLTGRVRLKWKN